MRKRTAPLDPSVALAKAVALAREPTRDELRMLRLRERARRSGEIARAAEAERRAKEEAKAKERAAREALKAVQEKPKPCPVQKRIRRNIWFKQRAERDPIFRLNRNVRHAVNQSLRGAKKGRRWQELVGYTIDDLRAHLEAQFTDGMGWHNIGAWHVDHKRPLASFNITGPECPEFKAAWALENLQPLWARDNVVKGARWSDAA